MIIDSVRSTQITESLEKITWCSTPYFSHGKLVVTWFPNSAWKSEAEMEIWRKWKWLKVTEDLMVELAKPSSALITGHGEKAEFWLL